MLTFQNLDVYRCSIEFLALVMEISRAVPRGYSEPIDQLRRAALSVPLNIGEAAGRTGPADAQRTFAIARGSAMECAAVLDALKVMDIVAEPLHHRGTELLERTVAMLTKLCR